MVVTLFARATARLPMSLWLDSALSMRYILQGVPCAVGGGYFEGVVNNSILHQLNNGDVMRQ